MPNRKGNDKQAMEHRIAQETEDGRRRFIEYELDLLSLIFKQLGDRFDHPPEILENGKEAVERIRKMNSEKQIAPIVRSDLSTDGR